MQYLYCPRKVYFLKVAGIRIAKPKMEEGRTVQENVKGTLERFAEQLGGELQTNVYLESARLGLKGVLDALILIGGEEEGTGKEKSGEWERAYPVDVKLSKFQSVSYAWKMQLTAYASLVEENFGVCVKKGYIYLVGKRFLDVEIDAESKRRLRKIVKDVESVIVEEKYPRAARSKKCGYCEVKDFCV